MIEVKNISKRYEKQVLFHNFSYTFKNQGFYLIFGYSGCGKTTFVNMLMNIVKADDGEIDINGINIKEYKEDELHHMIAYMTQDAYLLPYLTVEEHFQMYPDIYEQCIAYTKVFHLEHVLHAYPSQLSGGERQRVCLLKALAMKKQIIILDEPSASLDEENKKLVFSLLKEISKDVLVICISHDKDALSYCDIALDFQHKNQIQQPSIDISYQSKQVVVQPLQDMYQCVKKKRKKEKKRSIRYILGGIMMISMIFVSFCIEPDKKIVNSLGTNYHLNYVSVDVKLQNINDIQKKWEQDSLVKDVVYDYRFGGEYRDREELQHTRMEGNKLASTFIFYTLANKENTYLSKCEYIGEYPQKEYEIMLGYAYASAIAIKPEDIIGKTISLKTGKGNQKFTVTGVFLPFTEEMMQYMKAGGDNYWDEIGYFTSAYTKTYETDEQLSLYEIEDQTSRYQVYFSNFEDLKSFEQKYENMEGVSVHPIEDYLTNELRDIEQLSLMFIPVSCGAIIIAVMFYIQGLYSQYRLNQKEFALYAYFGYKKKQIKKAFMKNLIVEQLQVMSISIMSAFLFMLCVNIINNYLHFYPYTVFSFHYILFVMMISYFILFIVCSWFMLTSFSSISWYGLLKERRDLL